MVTQFQITISLECLSLSQSNWLFPIIDHQGAVPTLPHLGAFSARRKFHNHEGVDIYCDDGTLVRAVEDGEIVVI